MKFYYNTPEIKVEELTKTDVLCASGDPAPAIPPSPDNNGVGKNSWTSLEKFL
jgi:hypothetical protein